MKLTQTLLIKLIEEAMEHGGLSCNEVHPEHTHNEWEDHKQEEEKVTKSMAKISIKPTTKLPGTQLEQIINEETEKLLTKEAQECGQCRTVVKMWTETKRSMLQLALEINKLPGDNNQKRMASMYVQKLAHTGFDGVGWYEVGKRINALVDAARKSK